MNWQKIIITTQLLDHFLMRHAEFSLSVITVML
jgi:hypothetical protein